MAIEQWGIFNVPYLLWHGPTLYNDHLRAERLAVELSLPVLTTCPDRGSNPYLPHARRTLFLYATAAVELIESWLWLEREYNKNDIYTCNAMVLSIFLCWISKEYIDGSHKTCFIKWRYVILVRNKKSLEVVKIFDCTNFLSFHPKSCTM